MKKKIICVAVIVIIVILLFMIAIFKNNKKQAQGVETGAISQESTGESLTKSGEGKDVTNVYAASENYAIVVADGTTYIINNKGEQQGIIDFGIEDESEITINNNGYIYYSYNGNKILDKTGKIVFESDNATNYKYITENNYTLRTSKVSDFETGSSSKREIIDVSGNVIKTLDESMTYIGGCIWYTSGKLYNEKTGESVEKTFNNTDDKTYYSLEDGGVFSDTLYITGSLNVVEYSSGDIEYVSDKYYYNSEDYSIYTYDGNKVKEFSSGEGLSNIYYTGEKYYVRSGTKYFYVLNSNLEQIQEPNALEDVPSGLSEIGNNCILTRKQEKFSSKGYEGYWNHFYLYDYNGSLVEDLGDGWGSVKDIGRNIAKISRVSSTEYNEKTGNRDTIYYGNQTNDKYINLYTGTLLKVY